MIMWRPQYSCAKFGANPLNGELLGKWVKYNKHYFYLYTFLVDTSTGQTRRRIVTLDSSNNVDSRRYVPFGVSLILLPILGVNPSNFQFWGVNRRF